MRRAFIIGERGFRKFANGNFSHHVNCHLLLLPLDLRDSCRLGAGDFVARFVALRFDFDWIIRL